MIQPLSVVARLRQDVKLSAIVTELNGINQHVVTGLPGNIKGLIASSYRASRDTDPLTLAIMNAVCGSTHLSANCENAPP